MMGFGPSVSSPSSSGSPIAGTIHLESGFRSSDTRRSPLSHPAILLLIAVAVLFCAYALGYIPQVGSLLEAAIHSGQNTAIPALSPAFYGIAGLVAFLLLLAVLRSFDMLLRRFRKTSPLADRSLKPLAEFLEEAAIGEISVRVARESYHLLQPHYPNVMCIDLTDRLREDLQLDEEEIRVLEAQLLTRCDRRDRPSEVAAADLSRLITIFDLLFRIETAALLRVERQSARRERATDVPASLPAPEPRTSTSAQRKALHAAALHAIESRSLRVAETSGLKRRKSDYTGPRRRATDNRPNSPVYEGPYRRSTDPVAGHPAEASSQPQTVPNKAEVNQPESHFVPPRNGRISEPSTRN